MGIAEDFVLIVIAGLIGGLIARACRLPLLVGYVLAGVAVGPHTAGPRVVELHDIELLAEIGVALLLFSLGLEISFRDLQPVRRVSLIGGPLLIAVTTGAAALTAMALLPVGLVEAIWIGAMISVSSTMVVLKTLSATGFSSTLASRVMIGLLVMQDLAVIPMLVILPRLQNLETALPALGRAIGIAVVLLFAIYQIGTRLIPRLLKGILAWGTHELFLVAVVATGVGVGFATAAAGFSFALGAFIAGIVLSESEFSHQALSDVAPLRDIFGLLFFVTVGMLFDPMYAWQNIGVIAITIGLIILGKGLITGLIARAFGYMNMAPWIIGLGLAQVGEFTFVLVRTGLSSNMISQETYNLVLSSTVATMALTPTISAVALPLGRFWRSWRKPPVATATADHSVSEGLANHVIVAGYGRTGRVAARAIHEAGMPLIVVEGSNPLLADITAGGFRGIWGDITRDEILHAAGVERARVLMLCFPGHTSVSQAAEAARRLNPGITLVARATRESDVRPLQDAGVNSVIQPEFEGGIELVRQALMYCRCGPAETTGLLERLRVELYGTAGLEGDDY